MVEGKKGKAHSEPNTATDKQKALIIKLYGETDFLKERRYNLDSLNELDKQTAEMHIDHLIKIRRAQQNHTPERVNGFDKICYAMIYKLCWRTLEDNPRGMPSRHTRFREWVFEEYLEFKDAQQYAKEKVAEGDKE